MAAVQSWRWRMSNIFLSRACRHVCECAIVVKGDQLHQIYFQFHSRCKQKWCPQRCYCCCYLRVYVSDLCCKYVCFWLMHARWHCCCSTTQQTNTHSHTHMLAQASGNGIINVLKLRQLYGDLSKSARVWNTVRRHCCQRARKVRVSELNLQSVEKPAKPCGGFVPFASSCRCTCRGIMLHKKM